MADTAPATAPVTAPSGDTEQGAPSNAPVKAKSNGVVENIVDEATGESTPKEAKPPPKKYNLKYKNRDAEFTEEQLIQMAGRSHGAQQAFEEAKKLREEAEAIKQQYSALKDPKTRKKAIQELLGQDFDMVAEESMYERMQKEKQEEGLSEREKYYRREMELRDQEINGFRQKQQEQEQARQQSIEEATYNGIAGQIEAAALETMKTLNVPHGLKPMVAQRMVKYIEAALENGMPLDPAGLSHYAMQEIREEHQMMTDPMDGEALVKHLGESAVKKIREYDLARYEAKRSGKAQGGFPQASSKQAPPTNGAQDPRSQRVGRWAELEAMGIKRP